MYLMTRSGKRICNRSFTTPARAARFCAAQNISMENVNLRDADLKRCPLDNAMLKDADLRGAALLCATFKDADLRGVMLNSRDLFGAKLEEAITDWGVVKRCAHLYFTDHGTCGRPVTGMLMQGREAKIIIRCGCFTGSPKELKDFIAQDLKDDLVYASGTSGESLTRRIAKTRTAALDTLLKLLKV